MKNKKQAKTENAKNLGEKNVEIIKKWVFIKKFLISVKFLTAMGFF